MQLEDIPRFRMNEEISVLIETLDESVDRFRSLSGGVQRSEIRESLVRSIRSSVAIEGNELDEQHVSDILDGLDTDGPFDFVTEVRDAANAYAMIDSLSSWSVDDFLKAHDEMMFGLVEEPGLRTVDVGIFEGDRVIYKAPGAVSVEPMVERLFEWCSDSNLPSPIIASIAHFYIELIHPFVDGNGRMGRLWNTKVLVDGDQVFRLVPMEAYILARKEEYYAALESGQQTGECSGFVEFCLECLISGFSDLRRQEYLARR